jgi:hypothetical protein
MRLVSVAPSWLPNRLIPLYVVGAFLARQTRPVFG